MAKKKTKKNEDILQVQTYLDDMIRRVEAMPQEGMIVAINHYDYLTLLYVLSSITRSIEEM